MSASASGVRAGLAYVELGLKDSAFVKGLNVNAARIKAMGAAVNQIGSSIGAAGASVVVPFLGMAKNFADSGASLMMMSQRTGFAVETLSALGYAAAQTETDLSDVETSIKKMQRALVAGSEENVQAESTFMALGLSVQKLMKMSPEAQFEKIAQAVNAVQNPAARAGVAMQIFGKSGTAILPLIGNMDGLVSEATKLGLVMSGPSAKSAEALHAAMIMLEKVVGSVTKSIGGALAPELTGIFEIVTNAAIGIRDFIAANKQLTLAIFGAGVGLVALGAGIVSVGTFMFTGGAILSTFASVLGIVGTALGMLLSPIGLVITFVGVLAHQWLTMSQSGQQALASLGQNFGQLLADAKAAFGGIAEALEAGDIKLAAQILWGFLKVEFLKGTTFLQAVWADWSGAATTVFGGFTSAVAGMMTDAWAGIQSGFVNAIGFIQDGWAGLVLFMKTAFFGVIGSLAKAMFLFASKIPGSGVNYKVEAKAVDDDMAGKVDASGTGRDVLARKNARDKELAGIEANRQGAQGALGDQQQTDAESRRKAMQEGLSGGRQELDDAQANLDKLLAESKNQANLKRLSTKKGVGEKPEEPLTPDSLDAAMNSTKRKVDVAGSFAGGALAGMGAGSSVQDEQLAQQKKLNTNIEKMHDTVRRKEGGVVATM